MRKSLTLHDSEAALRLDWQLGTITRHQNVPEKSRNSREISRKSTFFPLSRLLLHTVDMIFFCCMLGRAQHRILYEKNSLIISRFFLRQSPKYKFQTESDEFNCKTESRMYCDSKRSSWCTIYLLSDYIYKKQANAVGNSFSHSRKKLLFEDSSELHCLCVDVSPLTVYTQRTHTTNWVSWINSGILGKMQRIRRIWKLRLCWWVFVSARIYSLFLDLFYIFIQF